ncbi:MAG TPA: PhnD/SsuA/transferrin family substrate-binding protein [Candidatus Binatia bacterium]|nr:PhnD/SsuA/transferrin family substrate-binding protein [Candidatus Binatia bacterium]
MRFVIRLRAAALSIAPLVLLLLPSVAQLSLARAEETLRFAVTDIVGLEELHTEYGAFQKVLSNATGIAIRFFPVSNRTAAVEALKSRKIDLVLTGPAEYIIFRNRTDAYPIVGFSRPDYFAALVTMADSGIGAVKDLKHKKVAFGDVGSTSKHLAPMQLLKEAGLDPLKDIQAQHVATNVGWEALKRGDVAAFGMTYSNFLALRDKEKQLEPAAFRVISRGPDLPNDPLLAGGHVDKKIVEKLRQAFQSHSQELIRAILTGKDTQKYKGMKFLTRIEDRDYDYVRAMYATIGRTQYAQFLGGN